MYSFLMVPSRAVMLDLEADDSCEAKSKSCSERAVKLRLEWDYNFGMSWNFRVLDDFGLDGTWTCGTQFVWFLSAVTSFAWVFIFAAWHVYGFHVHGNHGDLFCSFVKGCACIDSWIWIEFAVCHKFALFFVLVWDIGVWSITYYLSRCAARILG